MSLLRAASCRGWSDTRVARYLHDAYDAPAHTQDARRRAQLRAALSEDLRLLDAPAAGATVGRAAHAAAYKAAVRLGARTETGRLWAAMRRHGHLTTSLFAFRILHALDGVPPLAPATGSGAPVALAARILAELRGLQREQEERAGGGGQAAQHVLEDTTALHEAVLLALALQRDYARVRVALAELARAGARGSVGRTTARAIVAAATGMWEERLRVAVVPALAGGGGGDGGAAEASLRAHLDLVHRALEAWGLCLDRALCVEVVQGVLRAVASAAASAADGGLLRRQTSALVSAAHGELCGREGGEGAARCPACLAVVIEACGADLEAAKGLAARAVQAGAELRVVEALLAVCSEACRLSAAGSAARADAVRTASEAAAYLQGLRLLYKRRTYRLLAEVFMFAERYGRVLSLFAHAREAGLVDAPESTRRQLPRTFYAAVLRSATEMKQQAVAQQAADILEGRRG